MGIHAVSTSNQTSTINNTQPTEMNLHALLPPHLLTHSETIPQCLEDLLHLIDGNSVVQNTTWANHLLSAETTWADQFVTCAKLGISTLFGNINSAAAFEHSLQSIQQSIHQLRASVLNFGSENYFKAQNQANEISQARIVLAERIEQRLQQNPAHALQARNLRREIDYAKGIQNLETTLRGFTPILFARNIFEMATPLVSVGSSIASSLSIWGVVALGAKQGLATVLIGSLANAFFQSFTQLANAQLIHQNQSRNEIAASLTDSALTALACGFLAYTMGLKRSPGITWAALTFSADVALDFGLSGFGIGNRIFGLRSESWGHIGLGLTVTALQEIFGDAYSHGAHRINHRIQHQISLLELGNSQAYSATHLIPTLAASSALLSSCSDPHPHMSIGGPEIVEGLALALPAAAWIINRFTRHPLLKISELKDWLSAQKMTREQKGNFLNHIQTETGNILASIQKFRESTHGNFPILNEQVLREILIKNLVRNLKQKEIIDVETLNETASTELQKYQDALINIFKPQNQSADSEAYRPKPAKIINDSSGRLVILKDIFESDNRIISIFKSIYTSEELQQIGMNMLHSCLNEGQVNKAYRVYVEFHLSDYADNPIVKPLSVNTLNHEASVKALFHLLVLETQAKQQITNYSAWDDVNICLEAITTEAKDALKNLLNNVFMSHGDHDQIIKLMIKRNNLVEEQTFRIVMQNKLSAMNSENFVALLSELKQLYKKLKEQASWQKILIKETCEKFTALIAPLRQYEHSEAFTQFIYDLYDQSSKMEKEEFEDSDIDFLRLLFLKVTEKEIDRPNFYVFYDATGFNSYKMLSFLPRGVKPGKDCFYFENKRWEITNQTLIELVHEDCIRRLQVDIDEVYAFMERMSETYLLPFFTVRNHTRNSNYKRAVNLHFTKLYDYYVHSLTETERLKIDIENQIRLKFTSLFSIERFIDTCFYSYLSYALSGPNQTKSKKTFVEQNLFINFLNEIFADPQKHKAVRSKALNFFWENQNAFNNATELSLNWISSAQEAKQEEWALELIEAHLNEAPTFIATLIFRMQNRTSVEYLLNQIEASKKLRANAQLHKEELINAILNLELSSVLSRRDAIALLKHNIFN